MPKKETGTIKRETIVRDLPCRLNNDELIEAGMSLAEVVQKVKLETNNLDAEKERFKEAKKEIENKLVKLRVRESELSRIVSDRAESRDVDCESVFDYEAGRVTVRRLDTDEVIEDRDMQGLENQMVLDYDKENKQSEGDSVPITPESVVCENCDGAGVVITDNGDESICPICNGEGVPIITCQTCEGTGEEEYEKENGGGGSAPCHACSGKGYIRVCDKETEETEQPDTETENE